VSDEAIVTERAVSLHRDKAHLISPGRVTIRVDEARKQVSGVWTCGDSRRFTAGDLRTAVRHINLLRKYPDAWLELTDSHGSRYAARFLDDDKLQLDGGINANARSLSWGTLRDAAIAMLAEKQLPAQTEATGRNFGEDSEPDATA